MPINRQRYADNWSDIALSVKEAALWRCRHCGKQCLRPGEKPSNLTRSEWTMATLSVHHANFMPEDNRLENLIPLCTPCHIAVHGGRNGNVSPGQLSLFSYIYDENGVLTIIPNIHLFSLTFS
ncbi:HNH endonuclease [Coleofasciculus sp. E1-EBD-02]|uniref:HNH endonuclease n=1 Tax=Coleofasciculus sp. E1-EBD-02 TaxID=3068481 RepID=UPI0032FCF66E